MPAGRKRSPPARCVVAKKLKEDWSSPQQISGWLAKRYPDDEAMHVSHETIYRTLFVQTRGVLKKELLAHLRSGRTMRYSRRRRRRRRCSSTSAGRPGQIKDAVSIRERPAQEVLRIGLSPSQWEGDLLSEGRATPT
jgi:IS30 family transposase